MDNDIQCIVDRLGSSQAKTTTGPCESNDKKSSKRFESQKGTFDMVTQDMVPRAQYVKEMEENAELKLKLAALTNTNKKLENEIKVVNVAFVMW